MFGQSIIAAAGLDPDVSTFLIGIVIANLGVIFTGIFAAVWKISALETQGKEYRRDINNLGRLYRSSNKALANDERKAG